MWTYQFLYILLKLYLCFGCMECCRMNRVGVFGQISEINDHLFLSGAGVLKPEKIRQKRISLIVNATTEEPCTYLEGVDSFKVRVDDHPYARLHEHFDMVADRIKACKERGGKALVHCMAGVSRSASLVMVYLMKHCGMSLRQAYHYVKSARPIIRPNVGFWKQMVDYEKKLRGAASVTMILTPQCDLPIPDVYCEELRRMAATTTIQRTPAPSFSSTKRRGNSAVTLRPTMTTSTYRRSTSPTPRLGVTSSYSLFSPAPSRKPRDSLFSIYSSTPRHTFFSAF